MRGFQVNSFDRREEVDFSADGRASDSFGVVAKRFAAGQLGSREIPGECSKKAYGLKGRGMHNSLGMFVLLSRGWNPQIHDF